MSLQIIEMLIPSSNKRTRPGTKRNPRSITIHETDNTNVRANALAHARLQYNGNARQASWHYQVDDEPEIYKSVPENEVAYAAGDGGGPGNTYSIQIEICVNQDGNFMQAVNNAAWLVQYLLNKYPSISHVDVVQHHKWSGKNCPRYIRAGTKGINWTGFIALVRGDKGKVEQPSTPPKYKNDSGKFAIGQKVRVKNSATHYATGQSIPSWVKGKSDTVLQRGSNRILLKDIYSWVKASDLEIIGDSPTPAPSKPKSKSIAQMAAEVIAGKHGQGHANRRKSLGISQAEYDKVRAEVNRRAGVSSPAPKKGKSISQMAQEVIDGKHGNGHANRRKSLGISQAEYNKVRAEVNKRAGGGSSTPKKSISQMAAEVIAGKHGNGHAARRKSLGISQAEYEKVRAEVNRRA